MAHGVLHLEEGGHTNLGVNVLKEVGVGSGGGPKPTPEGSVG